MTDALLADIRDFLERHAARLNRDGGQLHSENDADALLARLDKRLSLPKLEDHDWILTVSADDEDTSKLVASLHPTVTCDKQSCVCHANNVTEWAITEDFEVPVSLSFTGGTYNSWHGDYDDTYLTLKLRTPPTSKLVLTPCVDTPQDFA